MANKGFEGWEVLNNTYLNKKYAVVAATWFTTTSAIARPGGSGQAVRPNNSGTGTHGQRDFGSNIGHIFTGITIKRLHSTAAA